MRRNRCLFYVAWLGSLILVSFVGGPIPYGIFACLCAVPVVALVHLLFELLFYRIYQEIDTRNVVSHRKVNYYFSLQNETPFAFSGIRVRYFASFSDIGGLDDRIEYALAPHSGQKMQTQLLCKYRGEYEVGVKRIILTDLFHLFSLSVPNPEPLRVIVKPDYLQNWAPDPADLFMIQQREKMTGNGIADVLTRKYVAGDPLGRIHWKATAAAGELMTRQEISEERSGVLFLLDSKRYAKQMHSYLPIENRLLETVLSMSLYYVNQRMSVTVAFYKKDTICVQAVSDFQAFYEEMAQLSFEENQGFESWGEQLPAIMCQGGFAGIFLVIQEETTYLPLVEQLLLLEQNPSVLQIVTGDEKSTLQIQAGVYLKKIPANQLLESAI